MQYKQSLSLMAAHLVVSSTCSCSGFVLTGHPGHDLTLKCDRRRTRLCGKRWRYDTPLENHIRVEDDDSDYGNNDSASDGGGGSSSSSSRTSAGDDRPHGYRDSQAVLEMPNNVYIDGEFHGSAGRSTRKKSNEIDPPEAYQILGLPDGCIDKAKIKKAYYEMVAKHHPDHNKWMNDEEQRETREKLYKINAAFSCIKSALQKRPKLRPGFGMPGTSGGGGGGNWYDNRENNSYFGY